MQNPSPLAQLRQRLQDGSLTPGQIAADSLAHSNTNASHNVYLSQHPADLDANPALRHAPLYAVAISLKDCFDLRGHITTCGSRFYADHNTPATEDSWIATQIKSSGAILSGKTHMHQLAYGITGQNPDFGDELQPANPALLTGGSSSGAAASVQEGSALAAIGTDTGGSIRVPAALCGLAGYRASINLPALIDAPIWQGGTHLAPSFDTLGLIFRDLRDGPALASALFHLPDATEPIQNPRIAIVPLSFLHDAEPEVLAAYELQKQSLLSHGATLHEIDPSLWADTRSPAPLWSDALDIFAPLQAHEAAHIQRQKLVAHIRAGYDAEGYFAEDLNLPSSLGASFSPQPFTLPDFSVFAPAIADRLTWGETFTPDAIAALHLRQQAFQLKMDELLTRHDLLLLPCAPIRHLYAAADHAHTRSRILRYTTPISLAGLPAVTLPHPGGAGMQLAAPRGHDAALLAYAATLPTFEPTRPT